MQKEIRTGNYFLFTGRGTDYDSDGIICWQPRLWVELEHGEINLSDIKPIPLTHDVLLACGFTQLRSDTNIHGSQYRLQVSGHEKDGVWFGAIGNREYMGNVPLFGVNTLCRGNYVGNGANYLHQLQNLYFALKAQELPIDTRLLKV